jgi:hypothetical protein
VTVDAAIIIIVRAAAALLWLFALCGFLRLV